MCVLIVIMHDSILIKSSHNSKVSARFSSGTGTVRWLRTRGADPPGVKFQLPHFLDVHFGEVFNFLYPQPRTLFIAFLEREKGREGGRVRDMRIDHSAVPHMCADQVAN